LLLLFEAYKYQVGHIDTLWYVMYFQSIMVITKLMAQFCWRWKDSWLYETISVPFCVI